MLYWIIGIFVSFFCIYAFISYIVFKFFVDRSVPKDMIFKGKDEDENENSLKRVSLPFDIQEVSIESINGLQLHSYFITNNASNKWIICVHGYSGNAFNLFPHINHFYSQGYNILAVDLRAHGKSDGKYYGLSYLDAKDILLWVDWIQAKTSNAKIALFGIALGGASVLMAASNSKTSNIKCVLSDSAPSDFKKEFTYVCKKFINIPISIILPAVNFWMKILAKYSFKDASPINNIGKVRVPCLIIHGENDHFVKVEMAYELFENIDTAKELLLVPNANHTQSVKIEPNMYWDKVDMFLSKYMK